MASAAELLRYNRDIRALYTRLLDAGKSKMSATGAGGSPHENAAVTRYNLTPQRDGGMP